MIPVYVYTRFSSVMQQDTSHEYQLEQCQRYCEQHGYKIVHHYKDSAVSATTVNREDLQNMINDVKRGNVKIVVVFKLERIFRDVKGGLSVIEELESWGCHIESTCENFDDDSADGRFLLQLQLALAERYINQLKVYTKTACINQAKTGKYLGGKPPFGFILSEDKKLIKDPDNYKTIETIFSMFYEGATYKEIAEHLNVHHMYNANHKPWSSRSDFNSIIRNKKYCGYYVYNRTESRRNNKKNHRKHKPKDEIIEIKGGVEAIVSEEIWQTCNDVMSSRTRSGGHNAKQMYKLSGILKCGYCGSNFGGCNHGVKVIGKEPYRTYRCNNADSLSKSKCRCREFNAGYIEKLATQCLCHYLDSKENIQRIVEAVNKSIEQIAGNNKNLERLSKKLNECEESIKNLVSVMEKGNTSSVIVQRLNELEKEKTELLAKVETAKKNKEAVKPVTVKQVKSLFDESLNVLKLSTSKDVKTLLKLFYKEIVIDNEKIVLKISMDSFFNGSFDTPLETLTFDREQVLRCKGTLARLRYRKNKEMYLRNLAMAN